MPARTHILRYYPYRNIKKCLFPHLPERGNKRLFMIQFVALVMRLAGQIDAEFLEDARVDL